MPVFRFDPTRTFDALSRKVNEFANEVEKGVSFEFGGFAPRVDISEDEKHIYLNVEIPGVAKEDVKLSINEENVLSIKGSKKMADEKAEAGLSFIKVERTFGDFARAFMLPDNVKKDSIAAKFENGVLDITLEKIEPEKTKEIHINIE
jgi:HSP20 family protein